MVGFNVHFFLTVLALCLVFVPDSFAVPSVRKLGAANVYTGTANASLAKSGLTGKVSSTGNRVSSVRALGLNTVKPATVANVQQKQGNTDVSRLSVGKYLHSAGVNAGIIKPIGSTTVNNTELDDLSIRIDAVENNITNNYYDKQEIDDKIDTARQEIVAQTNNLVQESVETATGGMAETVTDKVINKLATDIATKPDWSSDIFDD